MKKFFLSLAVFVMALCANAQTNQYFWYNGNLMMGNPIAQIDSVTFGEADTDSIMLYLPRTIVKKEIIHDTVIVPFLDTIYLEAPGNSIDYSCDNTIASGICGTQGDNITWSLCSDSILIFKGHGIMQGYSNFSAPWYSHIEAFHTAIVGDGITNIGSDMCMNAHKLKRVILPTSLKEIYPLAFHGAYNLQYVTFPDSLEVIGERSFLDCAFESITIPASVHTIGGGAFQGCTKLKTVYLQSSTPAGAGYDIFINVYDAIIFVPRGSLQAYQNAYGWSEHASQMREYDYSPSKPETPTIIHDTIYITIHDTVCPNDIPEGALRGVFSVAADKKVRFSKGNLQFHMKDSIWRFADKQYEVLGDANSNCGNPSYDGYIDLFGWSTASTYFGVNTSTSNSTYNGDFVDWAVNINNGWFTLSHDEWTYLYQGRTNADKLYGMACVNGVNGCIFLPDDWQTPQGVTFNTGSHKINDLSSYALVNNLTIEEWGKLEQNGAVFLPTTADRDGTTFSYQQFDLNGYYWTSTSNGDTSADCFVINPVELSTSGTNNRRFGDAVRLAIEVE